MVQCFSPIFIFAWQIQTRLEFAKTATLPILNDCKQTNNLSLSKSRMIFIYFKQQSRLVRLISIFKDLKKSSDFRLPFRLFKNSHNYMSYCQCVSWYNFNLMMKKQFRIVAFSDTHSMHDEIEMEQLPPGDIFIHAGDFSMKSQRAQLESFRQFVQSLPYKHKVVISGNHDFIFDPDHPKNNYSIAENKEERQLFEKVCHFLEFQMIQVEGLNILGINKGPEYFDWKFSFAKAQGESIIERYKGKVDILITHWPPFGILDKSRKQQAGSKGLRQFVQLVMPKIHIFGHIHEGRGHQRQFGIQFYNASNATRSYDFIAQPMEILYVKQDNQAHHKM